MRVRALSDSGDYTFGQSAANFLVNSAEMVGQNIRTRLLLERGEWFLDITEGTPWQTAVLGAHTKPVYDLAIQERVLRTPGVLSITNYSSNLDTQNRHLSVSMRVITAYSQEAIEIAEVL